MWQVWYLWDWAGSPGRRGTWRHLTSLYVAGVVLMGLGWLWWRAWAPWRRDLLRGRCGTLRHLLSFHVAGVALGDISLRLTWQAWYLWDWEWLWWRAWAPWRRNLLRGRRGTWRHLTSFYVASVVLMGLGWLWWRAWAPWRRVGTWWHPPSFCVAGLPLVVTHNLSHTNFHIHTHLFVTHTQTLSHTIFHTQHYHIQLCHTPSLSHTHTFVTPTSLSHTTSSHTIFHRLHTMFATRPLPHTHTHNNISTRAIVTIFHTQLYYTQLFTYNLFKLIDHPPPPLSILPSLSRCNFVFDLWGYPVL